MEGQQQATSGTGQPPVVDPLDGAAEGTRPKSDIEAREMAIAAVKKAEAEAAGAAPPPPAAAESPPPAEPPKQEQFERMASEYAKLEKRLRELEKGKLPELESKAGEYEKLKERLQNPAERYKVAEELGLDYREWADAILNDPDSAKTPEQRKIDALEKRIEDLAKANEAKAEETQKAREQATLQARRDYARKLVEEGGEKYEFTRALDQADALIIKYDQMIGEGHAPESDDAVAAAVEAAFEEQLKKDLQALSGSQRFIKLAAELGFTYQAKPKGGEPARQDPRAPQSGLAHGAPTLRNEDSAEPGSGFDYMKATEHEKREHAKRKAMEAVERQRELKGVA